MFACAVCHADESRNELVEEVFRIDGKYVLVNGIPATVCIRCQEQTFSRETTEKIRRMLHSQASPARSIAMQVFEFA